ncbi:MAG: alpha-amylase family glycosyl hydrolase, partial [Syntrophothermus sp.]
MPKKLISIFLAIAFLISCAPAKSEAPPVPTATITPVPLPEKWWGDAVFYEIFVRSFYDSNGDGIGDLNGITARLDYLNDGDPKTNTDLGVTGIWLMPIFPSPSYHGYDVTDYYSVNPQYGTMDDLKNLITEAHRRGIKIILDLVINHTSDQHPWFKSAKQDVNSPYRNWYIWSETDPGYKGPWGETVWHPSKTGFYYGIFEPFMPDLNYENPEVTAEMTKIYGFWLKDVGVDGFRLDAAKHLIEQGKVQQHTPATHKWYQQMYPVYKEMKPSAMTIGETLGDSMPVASRYVKDKEFDLIFNFQLASVMINAVQEGYGNTVAQMIENSNKLVPQFGYAPILTNHDQDRIMSQLGNDVDKARVAASVLLTTPGTPFMYYGEEIGMTGVKPDPNIRRPMQWSSAAYAGFTSGKKPWEPVDKSYETVNVDQESKDPQSLLSHYRSLIQVRNSHPALRTGDYYIVGSSSPKVYASLRMDKV